MPEADLALWDINHPQVPGIPGQAESGCPTTGAQRAAGPVGELQRVIASRNRWERLPEPLVRLWVRLWSDQGKHDIAKGLD